uniref:Uncharacterized protein n=1 Tax=Acrobeloides nanus TaxID=290746 RepID=A0A914EBX5_9BILA
MNFYFDQALEATLTLALHQLEQLENGIGDKRKHSALTRYRQRKFHSFVDEKYNTASPQDFQILFRVSKRQFDKKFTFIYADLEDQNKKAAPSMHKLALFFMFA